MQCSLVKTMEFNIILVLLFVMFKMNVTAHNQLANQIAPVTFIADNSYTYFFFTFVFKFLYLLKYFLSYILEHFLLVF